MSAQAAVVLTDAAGTPVNRSFAPRGTDKNGVTWWFYLGDGTVAGYNKLSQEIRQSPQSDVIRVIHTLATPLLETLSSSGASSGYVAGARVAHTPRVKVEWLLPVRSSLQDRKDIRAMTYDLLQESVVTDAVWNFDPAY